MLKLTAFCPEQDGTNTADTKCYYIYSGSCPTCFAKNRSGFAASSARNEDKQLTKADAHNEDNWG